MKINVTGIKLTQIAVSVEFLISVSEETETNTPHFMTIKTTRETIKHAYANPRNKIIKVALLPSLIRALMSAIKFVIVHSFWLRMSGNSVSDRPYENEEENQNQKMKINDSPVISMTSS
ncbi:hypothetical protein J9R20_005083 [Salmonella enterica]|nr:hypothetical protein [Salmonella enterica]